LDIEFPDFEEENATLIGDYLWQVVEIVIGGVPIFLVVHFMCLFMSLGSILSQGSVSTNLLDPMRHQVYVRKLEVNIEILVNISLVADMIPPAIHFAQLLGRRPSFGIGFLVYLSLLHEFRSKGIGFGLRLLASSAE